MQEFLRGWRACRLEFSCSSSILLLFFHSFDTHTFFSFSLFQMKRPIRPLLSAFLLIVVCTVLASRAVIRRSFIYATLEAGPASGIDVLPLPALNEKLLTYAAIEIGESDARRQINDLLEWNHRQGRPRSISSWRQDNHEGTYVRPSRIPVQLMNPKYSGLWPEFRQSLRNWVMNKRFQPDIMSELRSLVKKPLDRHYGSVTSVPTKRRYASCAVVGNSGILLKKEYGELIDSHEMVVRLNNARTEGFRRNVGSKTTLSFVNSNILHLCSRRQSCFCHPYGENVPMVMYICQAVHFMDFQYCNRTHKAPLIITDARFDLLCSRIVKYYSLKGFVETTGKSLEEWNAVHDGNLFHYSSGMQAIMLALGVCEKVDVFGFGKSADAKHHYHTNQKAELHLHDYEAEYAFYRDLIEQPDAIPFLRDSKFKIPPVTIYS